MSQYGNFTIAQRSTAKNINFDVKIDNDNDAALQAYGFYRDYTHNIDYPSITSAATNVEGLT